MHQAQCYIHLKCLVRLRRYGRYALIGANGCGKSTLLRAMVEGILPCWPENLKAVLVSQDATVGDEVNDVTPIEAAMSADNTAEALKREIEYLEESLDSVGEHGARCGDGENSDDDSIGDISERLCELYEQFEQAESEPEGLRRARAANVLQSLGFKREGYAGSATRIPKVNSPLVGQLSGGWRSRLRLAQGLLARPELLLLDEPSQHLDLKGVRWLAKHLRQDFHETCLVVSHDAAFVDAFATDIILFHDQSLTYFHGTWSEMLAAQSANALHMSREHANLERRKAAALKSADDMRKAARDKARKGSSTHGAREGDEKRLAASASRRRKVEKMGLERTADGKAYHSHKHGGPRQGADCNNDGGWVNGKRTAQPVFTAARNEARSRSFGFAAGTTRVVGTLSQRGTDASSPQGPLAALPELAATDMPMDMALSLNNVEYRHQGAEKPVFVMPSVLTVRSRSRIAIVGANGCGKTTLLSLITSQLKPKKGTVGISPGLRLGYVEQSAATKLTQEHRTPVSLLAFRIAGTEELEPESKLSHKMRAILSSFGLKDTGMVTRRSSSELSGGQRARLSMAIETAESDPDILVLDEPEAHLDIFSVDMLIESLQAFRGCLIFASHNEKVLREVATEWWFIRKSRLHVLTERKEMEEALASM